MQIGQPGTFDEKSHDLRFYYRDFNIYFEFYVLSSIIISISDNNPAIKKKSPF